MYWKLCLILPFLCMRCPPFPPYIASAKVKIELRICSWHSDSLALPFEEDSVFWPPNFEVELETVISAAFCFPACYELRLWADPSGELVHDIRLREPLCFQVQAGETLHQRACPIKMLHSLWGEGSSMKLRPNQTGFVHQYPYGLSAVIAL